MPQDAHSPPSFTLLATFCRVVEAGSLSAAAAQMHVTHTAVSKQLKQLEKHLGVQLLVRTSRTLRPTEAGHLYYARACQILEELAEAGRAVQSQHTTLRGQLRINAPMAFGVLDLAEKLPRFMQQHPELRLELVLNDQLIDVLEEGCDVALRLSYAPPDSAYLVAKHLATVARWVVAAPSYLARHGTPQQPADLAHHAALIYSLSETPEVWDFILPQGELTSVAMRSVLRANTSSALRHAALAGVGMMIGVPYIVGEDVAQGRLVRVLPEATLRPFELYALWTKHRSMPAKVRALLDFLQAAYTPTGH